MVNYQIVLGNNANKVERHGAKELEKYIKKMLNVKSICLEEEGKKKDFGVELLVGKTTQGESYLKEKGININKLEEDGFVLVSGRKGKKKFVVLMGKRDRGTLYSIYAFLEKQGCRFFEPYRLGEVVPKRRDLVVDSLVEKQNPTLPFRELDFDCMEAWNIIEAVKFMDWMVKNRLNTVMLTLFRNTYISFLPALINEIKKRDLTLGIGGHQIFPSLMLKEEFYNSKIPPISRHIRTFYSMYNRLFRSNGDPCLSNPDVVEKIKKNLIIFLKHHQGIELVRFQCSDGFTSGNHCKCEKCLIDGKFDGSHFEDIYFEAVKSIASEIEKQFPQVEIAYTYVSTFGGVSKLYSGDKKPSDMPGNVGYFYICLECEKYSYPLFSTKRPALVPLDPTEKYNSDLLKWAFSQLKGTGRKLILKEMHGSGYFHGVLRNTPHVIAENLRYLQKYNGIYAGSMIFTNLHSQDHAMAWHSFGLNLYTYYRLIWNIREDVDALLDDFHKSYFAEASEFMKELYRIIEEKALSFIIFGPSMEDIVSSDKGLFKRILQFHDKMLEEVESGKNLLDKAEMAIKEEKPSERLEIDKVLYRYLARLVKFNWRSFKGECFYKRAIKDTSSKERKKLLEKSKEELKGAREMLDVLIETGVSGYAGFQGEDVKLDKLIAKVGGINIYKMVP